MIGEGAQPVRHSLSDVGRRMLERDVGSSCAADREAAAASLWRALAVSSSNIVECGRDVGLV
jgi:hypothetical protein